MFLNIDGKDINAIYISTMRKEYENEPTLIYGLRNGSRIVQTFSSEDEANAMYDKVKAVQAGSGGMSEEEVQEIVTESINTYVTEALSKSY